MRVDPRPQTPDPTVGVISYGVVGVEVCFIVIVVVIVGGGGVGLGGGVGIGGGGQGRGQRRIIRR